MLEHLLIQFELDDGGVGKLYGDQKMAIECYYVSLKSLGKKAEPFQGEISMQNKVGKKEVTEAMIILSASTKEYRRPRPKPTSKVAPNPWNTKCLARTLPITCRNVGYKYIRPFTKGNKACQIHC